MNKKAKRVAAMSKKKLAQKTVENAIEKLLGRESARNMVPEKYSFTDVVEYLAFNPKATFSAKKIGYFKQDLDSVLHWLKTGNKEDRAKRLLEMATADWTLFDGKMGE